MGFKNWSQYGLRCLHQVFSKGDLKSFEQLRHDFKLPQTNFYRYLQLRHLLTTHQEYEKVKNPSQIEVVLQEIQSSHNTKRVISKVYTIFSSMDPNNTLQIKDKWETEFGTIILTETWTRGCEEAHSVPMKVQQNRNNRIQ